MSRIRPDQILTQSILDRLMDDDPEATRDPPKARNQMLRETIQAVRRDLENLLNTRRYCLAPPKELAEIPRSLYGFGVPDVSSVAMASEKARSAFRETVEKTIRAFEPRFKTVRVKFVEEGENLERTLRFRVDALLRMEPAPEPITFDTQLEQITNTFAVTSPEL